MKEEHYLFALSFSVGHMTGMALVVADNEIRAFQLLKNSGRYNGTPEKYELIACRNLGISATCVPFELLFEEYTRADIVYKAFLDLGEKLKGEPGESSTSFDPSIPVTFTDSVTVSQEDGNKKLRMFDFYPKFGQIVYTGVNPNLSSSLVFPEVQSEDTDDWYVHLPARADGDLVGNKLPTFYDAVRIEHIPGYDGDSEDHLNFDAAGGVINFTGDRKSDNYRSINLNFPNKLKGGWDEIDVWLPDSQGTIALIDDIRSAITDFSESPKVNTKLTIQSNDGQGNTNTMTTSASGQVSYNGKYYLDFPDTSELDDEVDVQLPSSSGTIATKEYVDAAIAAAIHEALGS